jgi:long-chain acyl-CoA synthetase
MNIAGMVWEQGLLRGDKVAVRGPVAAVTYAELRRRGGVVAAAARDAGLRPLDRAVLICPSVPEFPEAYYGLLAAGVVVVPVNTMATRPEIDYVLADSGASLVVVWHEAASAAQSVAEAAGVPLWVLGGPDPIGTRVDTDLHDFRPDDTSVILYTSGTTGQPKGAELTVRSLVSAATILLDGFEFEVEDRFATGLPLFHVYGQAAVMNAVLANGASLSLVTPFDPAELLATIKRDRITLVAGVPTMWNAMLQAARRGAATDFSGLRHATSGGAALPLELLREFRERFGCDILEGYGLTETCSMATTHDSKMVKKPGTVGRACPGMSVEVRDPDGHRVPTGQVGEVWIAGPTVMKGYWNRPADTAEALVGGWLRTGDLGTVDEDGYLSIVDRIKDLVIRGGYNVYPREVEEVIMAHPDVVEVAVVGVPDDHYGEEIAAAVVLVPGSTLDAGELKAWIRERLAAYKTPRLYRFLDSLPKGNTGKIAKRELDKDALRLAGIRG